MNIKYIINNSNESTFKEISGRTFKNLEFHYLQLMNKKELVIYYGILMKKFLY